MGSVSSGGNAWTPQSGVDWAPRLSMKSRLYTDTSPCPPGHTSEVNKAGLAGLAMSQAELEQVVRLDLAEQSGPVRRSLLLGADLGAEADRGALEARRNDALQAREVRRRQMNRMLVVSTADIPAADACDRPAAARCDRAFQDLQQRLLHALAGNVAGDGGVVGLAAILSISSM